ncbi:hypothetical protein Despr_3049 [Desulfobulbus propionicus DSM 2032]|uniref:Uncharacterized protein n=1 Tax=Desulfobulbus propionicus (strain ATCC 33891 / DSM 2032 / VKM B-1956 / 1pr3) TaxID=577650 RepID=A0A7U4DQN5_DESPD|nr:hypothetical protein [Desulfobulbus propionicus]ADW19182.1 hypothetical protein Despr_3049 [Desulfobulbus propionicus DSM 2032]
MDFGATIDSILQKIGDLIEPVGRLVQETHLPEQIKEVDFSGLFSNPWFLVPFIALVGYLLYKKALRDLIILGAVLAIWWASGTQYMQTLVVNGELQVNKVLPVLFGGAAILGFIIYLLFGRSD